VKEEEVAQDKFAQEQAVITGVGLRVMLEWELWGSAGLAAVGENAV
jgi:hypothetical protein